MRTTEDSIRTYFDRAASDDLEAYYGQFAPEAVVEDEGHEHHGIGEIRAWRTAVPAVTYTVLEIGIDGADTDGIDRVTAARTRISGDFPGSPVTLTFRFGFDDLGRISLLTIRP